MSWTSCLGLRFTGSEVLLSPGVARQHANRSQLRIVAIRRTQLLLKA